MDMRFHWLRCREAQNQFRFFWRQGKTNLADYWTKHHCAAHHIKHRLLILMPQGVITALGTLKHRTTMPLLQNNYAAQAA